MSAVATTGAFPPKRILFMIGLWVLFVVWMVLSLTGDLVSNTAPPPSIYNPHPSSYAVVWFALDFWALGAALIVGFVGLNPLAWRNGKRLIIGSMAFAMMLGRLFAGLMLSYLQQISLQIPAWLLVFLIPIVLWFDGIVVIGIVASIIGAIFGFFHRRARDPLQSNPAIRERDPRLSLP